MPTPARLKGTVLNVFEEDNYCFLKDNLTERQFFAHVSAFDLDEDFSRAVPGMLCEFCAGRDDGRGRPRANSVRLLS